MIIFCDICVLCGIFLFVNALNELISLSNLNLVFNRNV